MEFILTFEEQLRNLYNSKKIKEALELATEEERRHGASLFILKAKAILFGILGNYRESIDAANEALKLDPNDFEILNTKGVSFYDLEKFEEAIEAFNACLVLKPNFPIATQKKILALGHLKKYSEAIRTFEESDLPQQIQALITVPFVENDSVKY